ncbi:MAG: hypothetical protein JXB10_05240 [Pirellulales bacterium]|nr:hypothetical protein [Pirellulales bacterium]
MVQEELHSSSADTSTLRAQPSGLFRGLSLFAGVILPAFCFLISYPERPEWQSGRFTDYAQLFLSHAGSLPFYPLLLYNMTSMALMVYDPGRYLHNVWVRWGIYSGVPVALGFWGLLIVAIPRSAGGSTAQVIFYEILFSPLAVLIPWAAILFLRWIDKKNRDIILMVLGAVSICSVTFFPYVIGIGLLISFWSAPSWSAAAYAAMSVWIVRHRGEKRFQFSLAHLLGIVAWWASYFSAWRIAYLIVVEKYSQLPTEPPPDCYLCTAAARGHRRWVRSEEILNPDGSIVRVNDQIRIFKAFELLLLTVCPRLHRLCRRIYDRVGPILAPTLRHPLAADAAYTLLKPAEWLCRGVLRMVLKHGYRHVGRLYRPEGSNPRNSV